MGTSDTEKTMGNRQINNEEDTRDEERPKSDKMGKHANDAELKRL